MLISNNNSNNNKTIDVNAPQDLMACVNLIEQGKMVQAFSLLTNLKSKYEHYASVYYNLALCYYCAKDYSKAILELDKGLIKLNASKIGVEISADAKTVAELTQLQVKNEDIHKKAMHPFEPNLFNAKSQDLFYIFLAEVCYLANDLQRAKQIVSSLQPKGYASILNLASKL